MQKLPEEKKYQTTNFSYPPELRKLIAALREKHELSSTVCYLLAKEYDILLKNPKMPYDFDESSEYISQTHRLKKPSRKGEDFVFPKAVIEIGDKSEEAEFRRNEQNKKAHEKIKDGYF